jgi:hypothetical protein
VQTPLICVCALVQMISDELSEKVIERFLHAGDGKNMGIISDPREINNLKSDSDKLKGKTQYQG